MKKILLSYITLLLYLFFSCDTDNGVSQQSDSSFKITEVQSAYSEMNNTIYISAETNITEVTEDLNLLFKVYLPESTEPDSAGSLFDNGTQGDIIRNDGIYSILLDSSWVASSTGILTINVKAIYKNDSTQWVSDTLLIPGNSRPEIFLLSPEQNSRVNRGDTLFMQCMVRDNNGYSDIKAVNYYAINPDSTIILDDNFILKDSGPPQDYYSNDGIYSRKQPIDKSSPSNPGGTMLGNWQFMIYAKDNSSSYSDTLEVSVQVDSAVSAKITTEKEISN